MCPPRTRPKWVPSGLGPKCILQDKGRNVVKLLSQDKLHNAKLLQGINNSQPRQTLSKSPTNKSHLHVYQSTKPPCIKPPRHQLLSSKPSMISTKPSATRSNLQNRVKSSKASTQALAHHCPSSKIDKVHQLKTKPPQ